MYVDKPMLFLERPEQRFNELGEALIKAHYKVDGHDYMGIDSFVNDVVINGNDYIKQAFAILSLLWPFHLQPIFIFLEELDYYSKNGIKASEYVYKDITDGLFKM